MSLSPLRRCASALTLVAVAATAAATVVVHADVDRLAELADAVVDGSVAKRSVAFDAREGAIWTTYDVTVKETLLGEERETVTVHVPGGELGDLSQEVSGTARMKVGERVVLFLAREPVSTDQTTTRLLVLGQAQGCFRVEKDADTLVCRNDLQGLALVGEDGKRVDAEPIRMEHAELVRRVTRVARARDDAERRRREERERKLAELRERAERNAERTRGKPGGAE